MKTDIQTLLRLLTWYNLKYKLNKANFQQDGIAAVYYAWGSVLITASYGIAIYYGRLALQTIGPLTEITQNSARSMELKRQFNRNLIVQVSFNL
jgi:hypothetical protein